MRIISLSWTKDRNRSHSSKEYIDEFAPIKKRRNAMIAEAVRQAEALGHKLFKNWSPLFNTNRCRKCGLTVALPNVYAETEAPNAKGAAVETPCLIEIVGDDGNTFDETDRYLDEGVELNRDQVAAIASSFPILVMRES